MTLDELEQACRKQQAILGSPDARVVFVLPGVRKGETRRLWGRSGPIGHVVGTSKKTSTVMFKADEVLSALSDLRAHEPPASGDGAP